MTPRAVYREILIWGGLGVIAGAALIGLAILQIL